jgi:hypothetical protein
MLADIKRLIRVPTAKLKLYCLKVVKPCYDFELAVSLLLRVA